MRRWLRCSCERGLQQLDALLHQLVRVMLLRLLHLQLMLMRLRVHGGLHLLQGGLLLVVH